MPSQPTRLFLLPPHQSLALTSLRQDTIPPRCALVAEAEALGEADGSEVGVAAVPADFAEVKITHDILEEEGGGVGCDVGALEAGEGEDVAVGGEASDVR